MDGRGVVDDDWRAAKRVLWEGDDVERLKQLVRARHVHARDGFGCTLLHTACAHGHVRSTFWLLQSGADTEVRSDWGQTSLHSAAANGHVDCGAVLLRHGAHVDPVNKWGQTPLWYAVRNDYQQVGCLLLDAGAALGKFAHETVWVYRFLRGRAACAKAAKIFIGISDRRHRDVARLVAKMLWDTRGHEAWL